jgi:GMP synthase (glutamine-hydrolysing)
LVSVLAVNNYPSTDRFERLRSCLEEGGASVTVADRASCSVAQFDSFDGVALSGSPDMLSDSSVVKKYMTELDAIRKADVPILGVCFGHQLIAIAFGSEVVKAREPVQEFVNTELLVPDPLFEGLPASSMLLESRHEIVKSLPDDFILLARSDKSPIAGMKHRVKPLYGVQSHPERYTLDNPAGKQLVRNFIETLA